MAQRAAVAAAAAAATAANEAAAKAAQELAELTTASDIQVQQALQNVAPRYIAGGPDGTILKCARFLAGKYGGQIEDWYKYSTNSFKCPKGIFEIHYFWNEATQEAYELKTILHHWYDK